MTFATPILLALLPLLAIPIARELLSRRPAPVLVVADAAPARAAARPTWRLRLRRLPTVLRALAIVLVVLALARPREGLAVTALPEEGLDIVIAQDVSGSMTSPMARSRTTRIAAAQAVLTDFVKTMQGNRVGLVIFQARALTLAPITDDLAAIRSRIGTLHPGLIQDGTAIGLGLSEAVSLIKDSPARSRVIVLLTDGENNAGQVTPLQAARVAEALGIRIYTIGFLGDTIGGPDRQMLTTMAQTTGGRSYDASTPEDLATAYREIGGLERSRIGVRRFTTFREFAPVVAGIAVALLAVEGVLRATWFRSHP
jgi:Ca-activated chloride channel homolog